MSAVGDTRIVLKPLLGTDEATLDSKGRILLGKKKRDRLGDSFAMAIGELGCICIYPEDRWQERLIEINNTDPMNPGRQDYARLFFAMADDDLSCDTQGRVVIPEHIRKKAHLKEKVLLVGCFDHIEVWDPQEYQEYWKYQEVYAKERRVPLNQAYSKMKGLTTPASS